MPAYVIAQLQIEDADMYRRYTREVAPTVAPFGGRLIVASNTAEVLEGLQPFPRTVIGEFPTIDAARAWYESPAYDAIRELRTASTRGCVFIVDGISLSERVAPGGERPN
jgi:uncharacterized protein (DUF1330 family)